jgi:hypothetical protein
MTIETFEVLFKIIMIGLGLYLAFFKSYFQEKGKNLATSEDIEELTTKVEKVKQQFLEKNASIKAKLDLLTNLQINHKNDERLALVNFHKKIKYWITLLTESTPTLINSYNDEEIETKINLYDNVYKEVLSAEALLELYVEDKNFIKLMGELKINTLKNLADHPVDFLFSLKKNNFEFQLHEKMPVDTVENISKKSERHTELLKLRSIIYTEYRTKMIDSLKINIITEREYRNYIVEYIKNISKE